MAPDPQLSSHLVPPSEPPMAWRGGSPGLRFGGVLLPRPACPLPFASLQSGKLDAFLVLEQLRCNGRSWKASESAARASPTGSSSRSSVAVSLQSEGGAGGGGGCGEQALRRTD